MIFQTVWGKKILPLIVLLSSALHAIDAAAGHMVEALPERDIGQEVYSKYCFGCHGSDRLGVPQAPLDAAHMQPLMVKTIMTRFRKRCQEKSHALALKVYEQVKVARYLQRATLTDTTPKIPTLRPSISVH